MKNSFPERALFFFITLFVLSSSAMPAFARFAQDEDFGVWSQNDVEKKLDHSVRIKAGEELRFREAKGLYYYETHASAAYEKWKHIWLTAEHVQARSLRKSGKKEVWYWETRPRIYATLRESYRGYLLENRNMLEFRFKEDLEDTLRYRNQTQLTLPYKWTRFEFQPYISNEIFIESNRNGFIEDRLISGTRIHWYKNLYGSLFYLRQFQKNNFGSWTNMNILGVGFKVSL